MQAYILANLCFLFIIFSGKLMGTLHWPLSGTNNYHFLLVFEQHNC